MANLQGKSIIITGAGSGIGAAAALIAGRAGARVTLADVNEAGGRRVTDEIVAAGGEAQFIRTDISDEAQVKAMVTAARTTFGGLHGAFNNAGVPPYSYRGKGSKFTLFADLDVDIFRSSLAVNVVGTFLCMKYEIRRCWQGAGVRSSTHPPAPAFSRSPERRTISPENMASSVSQNPRRSTMIRVNALLPGVTRTGMMEASFSGNPELYNWAAEMQPTKRLGNADEVAEGALWLLSDAASFVTGVSLPVDGGYSMV